MTMSKAKETLFKVVLNEPDWTSCLIEAIPDAIVIADTDGVVQYVNAGYLRLAGLKREDIIGKDLAEVRPGAILPHAIRSGEAKLAVYRRVGDTEYITDVSPIFHNGTTIGGVSVSKQLKEFLLLSKELERYVRKTKELRSVVNRAYQARYRFEDIIGNSPRIQEAMAMGKRIALCEADILITGESGTGKEMFAQAIHNASSRAELPFVAVNCSTLNSALLESELFGYEDGAFTGARKGGKIGLFSVSEGGTIMLDEIAELSYDMQAKLLRVLQERTVRKVGDHAEWPVDIRVIAATNKHLLELTKQGKFREDLYYRLNAMSLEIPPLRDRKSDSIVLAEHFLVKWAQRNGKYWTFHPSVLEKILRYDWPGNIRELKNVVEFAAYTCDRSVITDIHLPKAQPGSNKADDSTLSTMRGSGTLKKVAADTQRAVIQSMLDKYGDTLEAKKTIAMELGISLATLYNKCK
jgi:transcriptional regulator with PAS, ATPase and Fis domain